LWSDVQIRYRWRITIQTDEILYSLYNELLETHHYIILLFNPEFSPKTTLLLNCGVI